MIVLIWGPIGVSLLAAGLAMWASGAFPAWLPWLGLAAGVAGILACVVLGAGTDGSPPVAGEALATVAALAMWVWMVGTGVVLFRRAGATRAGVAGA
ncbi:MAG TPA: hypothetical protein VF423_08625 [Actinomycetes bacterium]